ncbi:hypothetical protein ACQ7CX_20875 [Chryseobacterium arthrosphaerae]|uniref:hypothetical protein n=1 Tax=Chryseobacterium arthrosphaerae TaxID=651561 RepID=UPI001BAF5309|nr:hypothetical protein [Chryseobacterium arthrosphaerae]QUY56217.1 hypothetical protein I2F65_02370 [Chryseobacterium arthrosphaerae]
MIFLKSIKAMLHSTTYQKMMIKIISTILCIFTDNSLSAQYSGWRDQFVKWNLEFRYNKVFFIGSSDVNINKYSFLLSADVALNENDVFDSSTLYLQPYFELSLPYSFNDKISFSNYSVGLHVKKFMNGQNQKNNFYFIIGGKIDITASTIIDKKYKKLKNDFLFDAGVGYTVTNRAELYFLYTRGFNKIYLQEDLTSQMAVQTYSVGIRFGLLNNWWFR